MLCAGRAGSRRARGLFFQGAAERRLACADTTADHFRTIKSRNQAVTKWNSVVRIICRSPVLWGVLVTTGFYGLIELGVLKGDFIGRYFLAHPILGAEVGMFFIGMAALLLKLLDVAGQYPRLTEPLLGPKLRGGQMDEDFDALLARLERLPQGARATTWSAGSARHWSICGVTVRPIRSSTN